jgi:hypothetical protein
MEHRRFLAHPQAHHPFVGSDLLMRIGGCAAVETLIDRLYDRIDTDAVLRPLFGRDLTNQREAQMRFLPSGSAATVATVTVRTCRSSIVTICSLSLALWPSSGSRISTTRLTRWCRTSRRVVLSTTKSQFWRWLW